MKAGWPSLICHGRRIDIQFGERPYPTDTQHDFLLDAGDAVTAVQAVSDIAVVGRVLREIGIEQDTTSHDRCAPAKRGP
jgi:hypothetical protein